MDERAPARIGRLVARGSILQTFDDRGFAGAIVADDDGDGGEEFDDGYLFVIEGTDTADGEFIQTRHGGQLRPFFEESFLPSDVRGATKAGEKVAAN